MAYRLDEQKAVALLLRIKADIDELLVNARNPMPDIPKSKGTGVCKYCNEEGLYWTETSNGWRLLDDQQKQHKCDNYKGAK